MKSIQNYVLAGIVLTQALIVDVVFANTGYEDAFAKMEDACPGRSEDIGVAIDTSVLLTEIWRDAADRAAFENQYVAENSPSTAELNAVMSSVDAINFECNAYRLAVLQILLATNNEDTQTSVDAAGGLAYVPSLAGNRWQAGDVRVTGRPQAAQGWVFLAGQTIGSDDSTADLKGGKYQNLFELAKTWAPNSGSESWAAGQAVTLPDMRGRSIYAADNMSGVSANRISSAQADTVGGTFGAESRVIQESQMPTHTHTMDAQGNHSHSAGTAGNHGHAMNNAGHHNHPMANAGAHTHKLPDIRRYLNVAAGTNYTAPWLRAGADLSTRSAGNHKHTLTAAGNHKHTITAAGNHAHTIAAAGSHAHSNANAGDSQAINTMSPGIVFNVEMKF